MAGNLIRLQTCLKLSVQCFCIFFIFRFSFTLSLSLGHHRLHALVTARRPCGYQFSSKTHKPANVTTKRCETVRDLVLVSLRACFNVSACACVCVFNKPKERTTSTPVNMPLINCTILSHIYAQTPRNILNTIA